MDAHREIELRYRLKGLARELPAKLALIALAPTPARLPERKDPRASNAFRELLAMRSEIRDGFSSARLGLLDLSARLGAGPAAPAARQLPAPSGAAAPPAAGGAPAPAAEAGPARRARPRPRNLPLFLLVAGLAAAASYLLPLLDRQAAEVFPVPHQSAAGLCRGHGGLLFFADPRGELLFTLSDADGRVKSVRHFPVRSLAGLAFDGNYFWSSGAGGIARHEASGQLLALKSFPEAGSAAGPLAWDGKYLWAASPEQGRLVKYLPGETLFLSGNYPLPPSPDAGFFPEGADLYAAEQRPPRLCRYRPDQEMAPAGCAPLGRFLPPGARLSGFTLDKDWLWLITDSPQELRRVRRGALAFGGAGR